MLPNGMINFQKMRMVAQVITLIQSLQQRAYNFKVVDGIQKLLEQAQKVNVDEEELYQKSTAIEKVRIPHSMSARKMIHSLIRVLTEIHQQLQKLNIWKEGRL